MSKIYQNLDVSNYYLVSRYSDVFHGTEGVYDILLVRINDCIFLRANVKVDHVSFVVEFIRFCLEQGVS
jgi:hypothetical protein